MATNSKLECDLSTIPKVGVATPAGVDFSDIPLERLENGKKKKLPRRLIHFSDGIVEEYSTDEEEEEAVPEPAVNPKELTWVPWTWFYTVRAATKTLAAVDFCGEKLAWFLGITSPKYQSAIDEYYRLKAEEEEEERRLERHREAETEEATKELDTLESGAAEDNIATITVKNHV